MSIHARHDGITTKLQTSNFVIGDTLNIGTESIERKDGMSL